MRRFALVLLLSLVLAPGAGAAVTLGLYGDAPRFRDLTGQRTASQHVFPSWDVTAGRLDRLMEATGPMPLIAIQPKKPNGGGEAITPRGIARGKGDAYLIRVSLAVARFGEPIYIRPMPEMNGHWNTYCAYNRDGTKRGQSHSQAAFRDAFRRIYVIVHGGSKAEMDAKLARFGLPGVATSLPENPDVRVIWNPQGFGSPNVPGNMPQAYWPGPGFVDVVGNDLYSMAGRVTWEAAKDLYRAHPEKPHAFPEWGLWGIDDPGFIRDMRRFVNNHPRVELLAWYNGTPGSIWDIQSKPASRKAYRKHITPLGR